MATGQAASAGLLMSLPLEVRHTIFEYAAARDIKPKKLLRNWFEKKEVKELIAQHVAADPNGPAPRIVQNDQYEEEESDVPELEELEDQDSEDEGEEATDGEDDGDSDDNGDDDEGNNDAMGQAQADEDDNFNGDEEEENVADGHVEPADASQAQSTPHVPASLEDEDGSVDESTEVVHLEGEPVTEISQHDPDEHGEEATIEADGDQADVDIEDSVEEAENDGNANSAANAPPPPVPAPVLRAARKWRYIPNFMRITHCPPPVELLLTSKQLNDEAKNWFYDVAVLRINATGSFAHTSFFEEAFSQITEAAFSPMENVRKVDVTFAWDTTWLRADTTGCAEAIFPALLRQRSDFVRQILSQAPDLREVIVHWHDSAQDDESANFMLDILAPFHGLNANIKIEEHYITADAKPHKRSIAGQRRLEFQGIIDAGLDRLF